MTPALPLPSPQSAEPDAFTEGLDMVPVSDLGEAAGFRATVICGECGGFGVITKRYLDGFKVNHPCDLCGGTGEVPATNEITNPRSK